MQNSLEKLIYHFEQLPGIGPRQARRLVYGLLKRSKGDLREFGDLIKNVKDTVHACPICGLHHTDTTLECKYCSDTSRDNTVLMIVEKDADLLAVEKSGLFNGYYVVLGGTVPITGRNPVRADLLKKALILRKEKGLEEVVLGLSATVEGEQTKDHVLDLISPLTDGVKISLLGRGLATGTELEYSDQETLRNALTNRK
ncbi:MAG: recombination mediator RecR [Patescibacteria group bacterium UBA2103]